MYVETRMRGKAQPDGRQIIISVLPSPLPISRHMESTSRIVCLYKRFNGLRIMSPALTLNSNFVITMDSTLQSFDWIEQSLTSHPNL